MFFSEKIKSINSGDKVLEIGPGSTPYYRSNVFLEIKYDFEKDAIAQRGEIENHLITNKEIVYYDGGLFPFKDKEFDYIICSHVIEHVADIKLFLSEMFRVANKGYLEYPLIYFEFLYNIDVHLNIIKYDFDNSVLYYQKKSPSEFSNMRFINDFINTGMSKGLLPDLYKYIIDYGVEGFEWTKEFDYQVVKNKSLLIHQNLNFIQKVNSDSLPLRFISKIKKYLRIKGS